MGLATVAYSKSNREEVPGKLFGGLNLVLSISTTDPAPYRRFRGLPVAFRVYQVGPAGATLRSDIAVGLFQRYQQCLVALRCCTLFTLASMGWRGLVPYRSAL